MSEVPVYVYAIASAVVFFVLGWLWQRWRAARDFEQTGRNSAKLLEDARREAENLRKSATLEAKEEVLRNRQQFEQEAEQIRTENRHRQTRLDERESSLSKKVAYLDEKESRLDRLGEEVKTQTTALSSKQEQLDALIREQKTKLEQIAGLRTEDAKQQLVSGMISEAKHAAARQIQQVRQESERTSRREAQKILGLAVQRYAADHVAEETVSVVDLPNDDMKGRIIGREGRNIRAFEIATGIDVIIDDTPEAVIISGFDPVRREVAHLALKRLIKDGRIHPGRIEEIVERTRAEVHERIREAGEEACLELGLQNVHPDLYQYVGRLQYRSSYGQNLLLHSKEVAAVSGAIADELKLDGMVARRCGFLHDIGKAVDHEVTGPHALIGGRLCQKYGESDVVINAVAGHHADIEALSPYTFITAAADAASASRPGARRESLENYVQRLENLEKIANSFDGVDKSYAIQAGREIRILVNHNKVSDADTALLAEEISRRVEGELEYPGQIKVMVIRETRATAYAK